MTIFVIIEADHQKLRSFLSKLAKTTEKQVGRRKTLFSQFKKILIDHARSEEKAVYAFLKTKEKSRDLSFEGYEEHHLVDHLVAALSSLPPSKETWTAKMTVVKELLEHHMKEEEESMFQKMRRSFNSMELDEMAHNMVQSKKGGTLSHRLHKQPPTRSEIYAR